MNEPVILPRVPSALIRLALADPDSLAGAVLVGRASLGSGGGGFQDDFDYAMRDEFANLGPNEDQLRALTDFRDGWIEEGIETLGIFRGDLRYVNITPCSEDPTKFRADMNAMADRFERMGL